MWKNLVIVGFLEIDHLPNLPIGFWEDVLGEGTVGAVPPHTGTSFFYPPLAHLGHYISLFSDNFHRQLVDIKAWRKQMGYEGQAFMEIQIRKMK